MTHDDAITESLEAQDQFYRENPPFDAERSDHDCDTDDDGACSVCGWEEGK